MPVIGKALRTNRIAVEVGPTQVQYVKNVVLVDMPDRLFQQLLEETIRRTTGRIVLDPHQSTLDPGVLITGELQRFGYDSMSGQVVVQYDAAMAGQGGANVESRRFTAMVPADGTAATVPNALNDAANQVATQVAQWIGG
jgi:cholesterol transport system auxiliary component